MGKIVCVCVCLFKTFFFFIKGVNAFAVGYADFWIDTELKNFLLMSEEEMTFLSRNAESN